MFRQFRPLGIVTSFAMLTTTSLFSVGLGKPEAPYHLIATASQRIGTDSLEVRVFVGHRPIELQRFAELIVAAPLDRTTTLDSLVKRSIMLVPSEKRQNQWDVYTDVIWKGGSGPVTRRGGFPQVLADNIFIVRQILLSSRKHPVKVHLDGRTVTLKPGEALIVLG